MSILNCNMWQLCIFLLPLSNAYKVAIIGGGISGTFTAKYLAEYDANHYRSSSNDDGSSRDCMLDEIVVYDVSPPPPGFTNDVDDADSKAASPTGNNEHTISLATKLSSPAVEKKVTSSESNIKKLIPKTIINDDKNPFNCFDFCDAYVEL